MIKASQQFSLIALVCSVSLACASPSWAVMVALKADLKASNEVPPNESKGTTGSVTATFDKERGRGGSDHRRRQRFF